MLGFMGIYITRDLSIYCKWNLWNKSPWIHITHKSTMFCVQDWLSALIEFTKFLLKKCISTIKLTRELQSPPANWWVIPPQPSTPFISTPSSQSQLCGAILIWSCQTALRSPLKGTWQYGLNYLSNQPFLQPCNVICIVLCSIVPGKGF